MDQHFKYKIDFLISNDTPLGQQPTQPVVKNTRKSKPRSGDLTQHLARTFYDINWSKKLGHLLNITYGLNMIHKKGIIHRDFHSGNILIDEFSKICDLGLNKSATKAEDDETYGIIPYLAPEILHGQHYTRDSDIYSLGMIMWEVMTGRRPFWDRVHDVELIIQICDGLRPPIDNMNAPEGYVQLIKECWNPNPNKRPTARVIHAIISNGYDDEPIERTSSSALFQASMIFRFLSGLYKLLFVVFKTSFLKSMKGS
ncbi:2300_t:CDS:2, partial [Funneliformis geosporum]